MPVLQGLSTAVAAIGSGVLLSGFMTGHSDGSGEVMSHVQRALWSPFHAPPLLQACLTAMRECLQARDDGGWFIPGQT